MLVGNVCSSVAASVGGVFATPGAVVSLSAAIFIPAPGFERFTAARPRNSAAVVTISKYRIAFAPMRRETGPSNTVNHLAFRVDSLAELRALKARLDADGRAENVRPVTHGNAWSVYFEDPEGNGVELFLDTPWHVRQPQFVPLDLSKSDAEIAAWTKETFAGEPDFGPLSDYQAARARQLSKAR